MNANAKASNTAAAASIAEADIDDTIDDKIDNNDHHDTELEHDNHYDENIIISETNVLLNLCRTSIKRCLGLIFETFEPRFYNSLKSQYYQQERPRSAVTSFSVAMEKTCCSQFHLFRMKDNLELS